MQLTRCQPPGGLYRDPGRIPSAPPSLGGDVERREGTSWYRPSRERRPPRVCKCDSEISLFLTLSVSLLYSQLLRLVDQLLAPVALVPRGNRDRHMFLCRLALCVIIYFAN